MPENLLMMPPAGELVITREELPWPERAAELRIIDGYSLQLAADERAGAKDLIKQAHDRHDPICASAHKTWQLSLEDRKRDIDPLETAVRTHDRLIIDVDRLEKQRAADAQRKIEAAAYQRELEEREKQIEHVEQTGGTVGEVTSVAERPVTIPIAPAAVMATAQAPAKAVGISKVQDTWKGEVTAVWALMQFAVANNRRPLAALPPRDAAASGRLAASTKGVMEVPGVRFFDEVKVASTPKKARG